MQLGVLWMNMLAEFSHELHIHWLELPSSIRTTAAKKAGEVAGLHQKRTTTHDDPRSGPDGRWNGALMKLPPENVAIWQGRMGLHKQTPQHAA